MEVVLLLLLLLVSVSTAYIYIYIYAVFVIEDLFDLSYKPRFHELGMDLFCRMNLGNRHKYRKFFGRNAIAPSSGGVWPPSFQEEISTIYKIPVISDEYTFGSFSCMGVNEGRNRLV